MLSKCFRKGCKFTSPVYIVGSTVVDLSEGLTNWLVNNLAQENQCLGYYKQYETGLMYGDISFETFTG